MEKKKIKISLVTFIILVVVLIAIIGFGIFMVNNYLKMQTIIGMNNKMLLWLNDDKRNVYEKSVTVDGSKTIESWDLGDLYKNIEYSADDGLKYTTIVIGSKVINYVESDNGKLNIMYIEYNEDENYMEEYNEEYTEETGSIDSFLTVLSNTWKMKDVKIRNTELNGKKCYEIIQPDESDWEHKAYSTEYRDAETGLPIKIISYAENGIQAENQVIHEYSYGTVTEKDITFLDNTKFTLLDLNAFYDSIGKYYNELENR